MVTSPPLAKHYAGMWDDGDSGECLVSGGVIKVIEVGSIDESPHRAERSLLRNMNRGGDDSGRWMFGGLLVCMCHDRMFQRMILGMFLQQLLHHRLIH